MSDTIRWALPLLAAGQAQKEITHNEAILAIDRLLHPAVISRGLLAPPAQSHPGDAYIMGEVPVGQWSGQANMLAIFDGQSWTFTAPRSGCLVWVGDETLFVVFSGTSWSDGAWPVQGLRIAGRAVLAAPPLPVAAPTGGETVDSECRATLDALLFVLTNQGIILPAD